MTPTTRLQKAERHLRKAMARLISFNNSLAPQGIGPALDAIERGISCTETAQQILRKDKPRTNTF